MLSHLLDVWSCLLSKAEEEASALPLSHPLPPKAGKNCTLSGALVTTVALTKGAFPPCPGDLTEIKVYGLGPVLQKWGNLMGTYKKTNKIRSP